MSSVPHEFKSCPSVPSTRVHYASLLLGSFAATGAIGWASCAGEQPLAGLVVLATIAALWAGFDERRLPLHALIGGVSVVAILFIGISIPHATLPAWLSGGPWSTVGQAISLAGLQLLNRRPAHFAASDTVGKVKSPQTSQLRTRSAASLVGFGIAAAIFGYLVLLPVGEDLLSRWSEPEFNTTVEDMTLTESIRLKAVQVFAAVWAFMIGACVGSLANVLVYRQPRGESVLIRPSACPGCESRIETRDNIPVFGWLRLGGKCRNCQTSISSRYPIVEAVAGAVFVLLVFVELTSGGANLPYRRTNMYTGFVWTIFYPKWDLIALTLYHFHLLTMLFTWCLMRLDGVKLPVRSIVPAVLIAIGGPLLWRKFWLVPPGFIGTAYYPQSLDVVAIALAVAVAVALLLAAIGAKFRIDSFRNLAPPLTITGAALGWQALLVIAIATCLVRLCLAGIRRPNVSFAWIFLTVTLLHHTCWRFVDTTTSTVISMIRG